MSDKSKRRWFQVHLSTGILLVLTVMLSMVLMLPGVRRAPVEENGTTATVTQFGLPVPWWYHYEYVIDKDSIHRKRTSGTDISGVGLLIDLVVYGVGILAICRSNERRIIRRREARKQ